MQKKVDTVCGIGYSCFVVEGETNQPPPLEEPMGSAKTNSRFQKGSATYTCNACGKLTRETGDGESRVGLCLYCWTKAGLDNELADGYIDEAEYNASLALIAR